MSDLSDRAESLFEAGRAGHEPSEEERERVLRGVFVRAGIVTTTLAAQAAATRAAAASGGAGLAGAVSSSGLVGLGAKLALGLALAGSAGASVYHYARPHSNERAVALPTASAHVAPRSAPLTAVEASDERGVPASSADTESPRGVASAAANAISPPIVRGDGRANLAVESAVPASAGPKESEAALPRASAVAAFPTLDSAQGSLAASNSSAPGAALSAEARALAQAQRALREGRNGAALSSIEQQESQFASGELGQERRAAKIVALCALGRVAEARLLAARFLSDSPHSPLAARVRATCAGP